MTIRLHLEIVGALLIILGAAHGLFGRYFGWKQELAHVSLLTRQVFLVHCFFIGLLLVLLGACSLFYADALLTPGPTSRMLLAGFLIFWLCRLFVQWFIYDPAIWRGRPFYTFMHVVFSLFWTYAVLTYGLALRSLS
jgi:hypothetical protein